MGPSYQNIGFEMDNIAFVAGTKDVASSSIYFREGDELALSGTTKKIGWVKSISGQEYMIRDWVSFYLLTL